MDASEAHRISTISFSITHPLIHANGWAQLRQSQFHPTTASAFLRRRIRRETDVLHADRMTPPCLTRLHDTHGKRTPTAFKFLVICRPRPQSATLPVVQAFRPVVEPTKPALLTYSIVHHSLSPDFAQIPSPSTPIRRREYSHCSRATSSGHNVTLHV